MSDSGIRPHGPRMSAKTTPLDATPIASHARSHGSGTMARVAAENRFESVMVDEGGAASASDKSGTPEQSKNTHYVAHYQPVTPDQAMALRVLRAQPLPLSCTRIARATGWRRERVESWVEFFAAKGLLRRTGRGAVWIESEAA